MIISFLRGSMRNVVAIESLGEERFEEVLKNKFESSREIQSAYPNLVLKPKKIDNKKRL